MNQKQITTNEEYRQLADINSRGACPRCQDKHDKPPTLRCKRCIDCHICDASGVTVGVIKCKRCSSNGFYHSSTAPIPHQINEYVKCFDCETCKDCLGSCVLDRKRIDELKKVVQTKYNSRQSRGKSIIDPDFIHIPPSYPDTVPFANGQLPKIPFIDPDDLHPDMMGILGIPITEQVLEVMRQYNLSIKPAPTRVLAVDNSKMTCPRCQGAGFTHESSAKHSTKVGEICKHCKRCLGCLGDGHVNCKQKCRNCDMRGFVHISTERSHDVPAALRCFFCKDCMVCKGTGLENIDLKDGNQVDDGTDKKLLLENAVSLNLKKDELNYKKDARNSMGNSIE